LSFYAQFKFHQYRAPWICTLAFVTIDIALNNPVSSHLCPELILLQFTSLAIPIPTPTSLIPTSPGIPGGYFHQHYMFWIGPMFGALFAAAIYGELLFLSFAFKL